jgi:alkylhydroperoxidase family enzyme
MQHGIASAGQSFSSVVPNISPKEGRMPNVPNGTRDLFGDDDRHVWDRLVAAEVEGEHALNFKLALANSPEMLRAFARFLNSTWKASKLDDATREIVILHCAYRERSEYEWQRHVDIGRKAGLTDAQILAARDGDPAVLTPLQSAVLEYADHVLDRAVSESACAALAAEIGYDGVVGTTLLVGFYSMTALAMGAFAVEPEHPFGGFTADP